MRTRATRRSGSGDQNLCLHARVGDGAGDLFGAQWASPPGLVKRFSVAHHRTHGRNAEVRAKASRAAGAAGHPPTPLPA